MNTPLLWGTVLSVITVSAVADADVRHPCDGKSKNGGKPLAAEIINGSNLCGADLRGVQLLGANLRNALDMTQSAKTGMRLAGMVMGKALSVVRGLKHSDFHKSRGTHINVKMW